MRQETLARLAAEVTALLEKDGARVFSRFVRLGGRPKRSNGQPYRGGNVLALWASALTHGYQNPYWFTFHQARELGAAVRKGEKSSLVVYVDRWVPREHRGDPEANAIPFLKAYPVFNGDQIHGLPDAFALQLPLPAFDPIPEAEAFIAATGANIVTGVVGPPRYTPSRDEIGMPDPRAYRSPSAYYADLMHELVHWTGAEHRLKREKGKKWADAAYAFEELVAEIGSAFLCTDLRLDKDVERDQAPYLRDWLRALKDDPTQLWTAGKAAEAAAEFLVMKSAATRMPGACEVGAKQSSRSTPTAA
jgi:antirestriction protein ArdC